MGLSEYAVSTALSRNSALALSVIALVTTGVSATDRTWIGDTGDPPGDGISFTDGLNWTPEGVPGVTDAVLFEPVGGTVLYPGGLVLADRLSVRGTELSVSFDLGGGLFRLLSPTSTGIERSIVIGAVDGDDVGLFIESGFLEGDAAGIGVEPGSTGTLEIDPSALVGLTGSLVTGESGLGTLIVGGEIVTAESVIGQESTGFGTAILDGTGSLWVVTESLTVADAGGADLFISGGAFLASTIDLSAARERGAAALIGVTGLGSTLLVGGHADLGGDADGPGGSAGLLVSELASVLIADEFRIWPEGTATVTGGAVEAASLEVNGGSLTVTDTGTASISESGSAIAPGLVVSVGDGTGAATVRDGGSIETTGLAVGADLGATATLIVEDEESLVEAADDGVIGWEPELYGRLAGDALIEIRPGAALDVGGTLTIRQKGHLRVDDGSVFASDLDATEESTVEIPLKTPDALAIATEFGTLGGGLFLEVPGPVAPVGTRYGLVEGDFGLDGEFAVAFVPELPGFRYVAVVRDDVEAGKGIPSEVNAEIAFLESKLLIADPVPTGLTDAPNAISTTQFDGGFAADAVVTVPNPSGVAGATNGEVVVLLNTINRNGEEPGFVVGATAPVGVDPVAVSTADLDGDGMPDVAVSNAGDGTVSVFRNTSGVQGSGLEPIQTVDVGGEPRGIALADVDGDDRPDLLVANKGTDSVDIFSNDGKGGFDKAETLAGGINPESVCPIDIDNDKDLDVIAVNNGFGANGIGVLDPSPSVFLYRAGEGGFEDPIPYEVGLGAIALADGDLDSDGFADVITANFDAGTISILVGKGDGLLRAAVDVPAGGFPTAIAVGDYDNDESKDLDIAILANDGEGGKRLNLLRNDSIGDQVILTLIMNAQELVGLPNAITSGNADGVGPTDLVSVGFNGGEATGFITVLPAEPDDCRADLNGDGVVNGRDLGVLLAAFGENGSDLPEDLNGNNVVDRPDVDVLFENWGECPSAE